MLGGCFVQVELSHDQLMCGGIVKAPSHAAKYHWRYFTFATNTTGTLLSSANKIAHLVVDLPDEHVVLPGARHELLRCLPVAFLLILILILPLQVQGETWRIWFTNNLINGDRVTSGYISSIQSYRLD